MAKKTKKERRERKRRLWLVASPFIVLAAMFWPLFGIVPSSPIEPPDPVKVANYQAQYDVSASGDLLAIETITGVVPNGRHGIFRYWDHVDPNNPAVRYLPTIQSITLDGRSEESDIYEMGADRYTVARIGNPDVLLTAGTHVYQIRYSIPGAISPAAVGTVPTFVSTAPGTVGTTASSVFWWNVVASGWRMPITNADVIVNLPSPSVGIACSATTSPDKAEGPCSISGNGTAAVKLNAKAIPAFGGMTTRVGMAPPAPPQASVPWPWQLDPILGRSQSDLIRIVVLAIGAAALGFFWVLLTRERKPGLPVLYAPPEGLGPVQTVFMTQESPGEHDLTATVFHLAQQGLLAIAAKPRSWTATATDLMTAEAIAAVDHVCQAVIAALGLATPGAEFKASQSRAKGETLEKARKDIKIAAASWAKSTGLVRVSVVGLLGRIAWVAALLGIALGLSGWKGPMILTIIPLAFAVMGYQLMKAGALHRRTRTGRDLWTRSGGFERMLSTPSSELRFDFSARKEFFLPYLPYAVAFGVAKQWSEKYTDEVAEPPPTPDWISYTSQRITTASLMTAVGTFETTVNSTISAYQSGSSSSSSGGSSGGGGGGSVGGGGGGGGGGSW